MRRYDESLEVVCSDGPGVGAAAGSGAAPTRFRWRHRWWHIDGVQSRWLEARPWWQHSQAGDTDVTEIEVWRVAAHAGAATGIYDLACSAGCWLLRAVLD